MVSDKDFPYIGKNLCGSVQCCISSKLREIRWCVRGYANNARQVILYDFAVQGYDVEFKYDGKIYHLLYEPDHAALCDENYTEEYETFENPIDLVENLRINGHRLIDIIDDLKDVEPE